MTTLFFSHVIRQISKELKPPRAADEVNFWKEAQMAKQTISAAAAMADERAIRAAAAAYGGLVKRWRRFLIEQLTAAIYAGKDTSRTRIREWQRLTFGQAIASSRLSQYAKAERSGGGRSTFIEPEQYLVDAAKEQFSKFKDRIKSL